jgi:hypothetical protein
VNEGTAVAAGGGRGRPWRLLFGGLLAILVAAHAAVFLRYLAFPYEVFGWSGDVILHNAAQLARGERPWRAPAAAAPAAFLYTPGYTLLLAPLVALFGPHPATGRLLTAAGVVLLSALLVRETRRRTGSRFLAWCAPGVLFLFSAASLDNLLWIHPDTWSVTFSLLALLAVTPRTTAGAAAAITTRAALAAALWSFAAVFTKQTAVGVVVAITLFLLLSRPRVAPAYLALTAALLAGAVALLDRLCDGGFLPYVLLPFSHEVQLEKLPGALLWFATHWGTALPLLAALLWRGGLRARLHDPLALAAAVSLPAHLAALLKANGAPNNFLALTVFLVPLLLQAVAALLPLLATRALPRALAGLVLLLAMVPPIEDGLRPAWRSLQLHDARLAAARELEAELAATPGPAWVACRVDFAVRSGRPVDLPAILLVDFLPAYPHAADALLARIDRGEFDALLIPHDFATMVDEAAWRPRLLKRYRPARLVGEGVAWGALMPVTVMRRRD